MQLVSRPCQDSSKLGAHILGLLQDDMTAAQLTGQDRHGVLGHTTSKLACHKSQSHPAEGLCQQGLLAPEIQKMVMAVCTPVLQREGMIQVHGMLLTQLRAVSCAGPACQLTATGTSAAHIHLCPSP